MTPYRFPRSRRLLALSACAAVLAVAQPLLAHLNLVASSPSAGEEITRPPEALRLRFTQAVQLAFSEVRLTGPNGVVGIGELGFAADSAQVLVAPVMGRLGAGAYTVRWRVAGADGHPISGEYGFRLAGSEPTGAGASAGGPAPGPGPDPAASGSHPPSPSGDEVGSMGGGRSAASLEFGLVRWATFVALLALIGAAAFRWLVLPGWTRRGDHAGHELRPGMERRAATIGAAAAVTLLLAGAVRLYLQADALGVDVGDVARLRTIMVDTPWGRGWMLQVVGAVIALGGLLAVRRGTHGGWIAAAIGAVASAFSPPLSGHAAGAEHAGGLAILADGLHVLGAGGWLGTLLVVTLAGLPVTRSLREGRFAPAARTLVQAFSPVALGFAGLVVGTGVYAAWIHLGSLSALWETSYGRILLIKLALLLPVLAAGAYNWRRATPALSDDQGVRSLRRSAAVELGSALLVLAATAFLVATPPPAESPPPPPAAAE